MFCGGMKDFRKFTKKYKNDMEYKMINVEVLEGSLILSPLQNPKECELLFETWMLVNNPAENTKPFPTEQLKNTQKNLAEQWAESIINSEEGQKLKEEMDKDFENRLMGAEQPQQDPISRLIELGYTEGKIFHRKDCLDYDCGHGIFTGEFGSNCDGITLKFTDGRKFLSDFCTLIKDNSPQVMWDITKELQRLEQEYIDRLVKFKMEYYNLK